MDNPLKVKFKIGEIEFEAEGAPEDVEHQRVAFMDTLLPAAVDAMVRTRGVVAERQYLEAQEIKSLPEGNPDTPKTFVISHTLDMSVNEFLNSKQFTSKIDTAIGLIYFNEKAKNCTDFSTDELKQYFKDAKITPPVNPSDVVAKLVGKSFIMESDSKNRYKLTRTGETFVDTAKPQKETKGKGKAKKPRAKPQSAYTGINLDELNLKDYPEVKSLSTFKEQMLLVMYIVSTAGKGDSFSVNDLQYLLTEIWGLSATIDQINGVFKTNKTWFKQEPDPANKKAMRRKLLESGKDCVRAIIEASQKKFYCS